MTTKTVATHTPGPWFPIKDLNGANNRMLVCNDELDREYRIADCGYADNFKAEANARLIAACPTMFDYISKKAGEGDAEAQSIIAAIR